jgi:hypothetical protein
MKTQHFKHTALSLTLILAGLVFGSQSLKAQEVKEEIKEENKEVILEEIIEETVEETAEAVETDSVKLKKVKKVIEGKRITIVIATQGHGEDKEHKIVIDLPEGLTDKDADNLERALEKAGVALEDVMEDAMETVEEALEQAEESMEEAMESEERAKNAKEEHIVIMKEGEAKHKIIINHEEIRKVKKPKLVKTSWNVIELGINEMLTPDGADLPAEYSQMKVIPAKSINFHWGIVQQGINLVGGKLRLVYGLGIDFNNYRFASDIDFTEGATPLEYVENDTRNYKKNKLVSQYLTVPLMLNFKSNPKNDNKSLNIAAGVHAGYLIQSHQKQKWSEDGSKQKSKIRGDYNFNQYRLGYSVQFGYGDINIYARYYPDPIFQDGQGPELNTASVGIVFMPF